ncbi:TetR family transcriptional regulator [Sphaerisporangium rufum]|uniref:TetR family transcriptional regulator n=1 Tax=Sphaerisporangium rufum TaxID=1381558 RepID=A0A919R1J4_9ACTN|nr:TetR/AcrR family transcriptional regulator [Sphaerisporangium rufum]GII77972.1 TetR family transcriptional regulator [Sphaerisporangium rufum]
MATTAERGRQVRQRLLRAAAELIAERGWTAVSTRMAAERAGVAAGLVHYHFGSVQALLGEAALGVIRAVAADAGPALRRARGPGELVDLLLAALDGFSGTDPVSLLFTETYLAATRDPVLRAALAEVTGAARAEIAARLAEFGVAAPHRAAATLTAAVDGVMLHRALDPDLTAANVAPVLRAMLQGAGRTGSAPQTDSRAGGRG